MVAEVDGDVVWDLATPTPSVMAATTASSNRQTNAYLRQGYGSRAPTSGLSGRS
jgi:hypothetical protein